MTQNETKKILTIGGMTCPGCELRIENAVKKIPGIICAEGDYADGKVGITFDSSKTELSVIVKAIKSLDYDVKHVSDANNTVPVQQKRKGIIIALSIFAFVALVILLISNTVDLTAGSLTQSAGYGALFIFGLITSLHCLFMCGSINLAVCTSYQANHKDKFSKIKPVVMYNTGRVVTYTLVGGIVGGIGSVIELAPGVGGALTVFAGTCMILMGLTMLNLFPALRKIVPRIPKFLGSKVYGKIGKSGPFAVGLLNGLMPCGALQSIQIYALGTGDMLTGALSMFFFSLGTVPLMFGFGALSSALSEQFTNVMTKIGAVVIMIMGLIMFIRGFSR